MSVKYQGTWDPKILKKKLKSQYKVDSVIDIPVFHWSYRVGVINCGYVEAYPDSGALLFQTTRGDYAGIGFTGDLQQVLKQIEKFQWGNPPHIEEVYGDIQKMVSLMKEGKLQSVDDLYRRLEIKWQNFLR